MHESILPAVGDGPVGDNHRVTRPRLVYLKVPKTASSSVMRMVQEALELGTNQILSGTSWFGEEATPPDDRYKAVMAHVTWNDAARLLDDPTAWVPIVTLRDPLERTVSHYRYLRQRALQTNLLSRFRPVCDEALARPLRELVHDETSAFHGWTMPVQTFFLGADLPCGIPEVRLPDTVHSPDFHHQALQCALDRLHRLAWIGIVETLPRDMRTLAFSQGWPVPDVLHDNRTTPVGADSDAFSELDPATRRVLANRLAADYVLLECAREIAAERYGEMVETMGIAASRRNGRA